MNESKKGTSHVDQLHRLNRIEGQIRGISKMIEEKRYCIDILSQIKAVKSALTSVETKMIEEHLNHCLHRALTSRDKKQSTEMIEELTELLKRATR